MGPTSATAQRRMAMTKAIHPIILIDAPSVSYASTVQTRTEERTLSGDIGNYPFGSPCRVHVAVERPLLTSD